MRDGASWSGGGDLVRAEENGQAEIDDEPKVQQEQQARPRERAGRSDHTIRLFVMEKNDLGHLNVLRFWS